MFSWKPPFHVLVKTILDTHVLMKNIHNPYLTDWKWISCLVENEGKSSIPNSRISQHHPKFFMEICLDSGRRQQGKNTTPVVMIIDMKRTYLFHLYTTYHRNASSKLHKKSTRPIEHTIICNKYFCIHLRRLSLLADSTKSLWLQYIFQTSEVPLKRWQRPTTWSIFSEILTINNPYLMRKGEVWSVFCEIQVRSIGL